MRAEQCRLEALPGTNRLPAQRARALDWLQGSSYLAKPSLERAVRHFSRCREWPALSAEEVFFLLLRLLLAQRVIEEFMQPEDFSLRRMFPALPDPREWPVFVEWLLITGWEVFGDGCLQNWHARLFEKCPPGQDEFAEGQRI